MGCDIHMVLEHRYNGKWVGMHDFPAISTKYAGNPPPSRLTFAYWAVTGRRYALFADLAGVRGGPGPEPKGLPDDMSDLARMITDSWCADGHSFTWYTLDEALPIFAAHIAKDDLLSDDREYICEELFGVSRRHANEYRLIIWFDN